MTGLGRVILAVTMILLGVLGTIDSNFAAVWKPIPVGVPAHEALGYLCSFISLACGIGLLWKRAAVLSAGILLVYLLVWSLLMNVPDIYRAHGTVGSWYGLVEAVVMVAAAWVVYAGSATDSGRQRFGFATSGKAVRIARVLYGLALVYFGVGHFVFLKQTVADVPAWLPWSVSWAYFTGVTFMVAGLALLVGAYARLASALATLQIGLFVLLVWLPIVAAAGPKTTFQWSETVISTALVAGALTVADSYRGMAWLRVNSAGAGTARG